MSLFASYQSTFEPNRTVINNQNFRPYQINPFQQGTQYASTKKSKPTSMTQNNGVRLRIDKAAANRIIIHAINQLNRDNPFEKNESELRSHTLQRILFFILFTDFR
jgi:hypothetical protein